MPSDHDAGPDPDRATGSPDLPGEHDDDDEQVDPRLEPQGEPDTGMPASLVDGEQNLPGDGRPPTSAEPLREGATD